MKDNAFNNKKILVVGMGRSGRAAVDALTEKGACVSIQDSKQAADFDPEFLDAMNKKGVTEYLGCVPEDMTATPVEIDNDIHAAGENQSDFADG